MKKILACVLTLVMTCGLLVGSASAAADEVDISGMSVEELAHLDTKGASLSLRMAIVNARRQIIFGDQAWSADGSVGVLNRDGISEALTLFADLYPGWDLQEICVLNIPESDLDGRYYYSDAEENLVYFEDGDADYFHSLEGLTVYLPVTNTWADSKFVCSFNGDGSDLYVYAVGGPKSGTYNLGYSVGGGNNLEGWNPNLTVGQAGMVIHTIPSAIYEVRASVPEGTGGIFCFVVSRTPPELTLSGRLPFTDIPEDADYLDAVTSVYASGLMNGTSATTFSPDENLSRAMMWTLLARMNGAALGSGSPWYAPAQDWAVKAGISDGTNPNQTISLQEVVTMLHRQAGTPAAAAQVDVDQDGQTAAWARDAMAWALSAGIVRGGNPAQAVTRAELAVILRMYSITVH